MTIWKTFRNWWAGIEEPALKPNDDFFVVEDTLQPLYFVTHPDGTYSVADPQPLVSPVQDWGLVSRANRLEGEVLTLRFLLSQAPMIQAPKNAIEAGAVRGHFAYIHPTTFAKIQNFALIRANEVFSTVVGSPTKWLITSLIPEDVVIYSPNAAPGLEKRLEEFKPKSRARVRAGAL